MIKLSGQLKVVPKAVLTDPDRYVSWGLLNKKYFMLDNSLTSFDYILVRCLMANVADLCRF